MLKSHLMKTLALSLLALSGALGQKINVEFDAAADFSRYHTFTIRDGVLSSRNPALNSELVKKRINADLERYLTSRGLEMVAQRPDLNVVYRLGSARLTQTEAYPAGWRGWGAAIVRVPYTEGTLVLDLRDPSTRSLVWRAIARVDKSDANKVEGKLDDMVRKSLDKYPPKPK